MSGLASLTVRKAAIARLAGDATLGALLDGIYDAIPETAAPHRYVVVATVSEDPDDTLEDGDAGLGSDLLLSVSAIAEDTQERAGYATVEQIADRVITLLHDATLTLEGGRVCVSCERETTQFLKDGSWRQAVTDFRVLTEDA